jgi:FkbM family methyltransferase
MKQHIKDFLVRLGPRNTLVRTALKFHGRRSGSAIAFEEGAISLTRGGKKMILAERDFYLVPITLECFDQTFQEIEPKSMDGWDVLNFSAPGTHRYKRHGLTLSFPGMPEDDSIEAYTHWYLPKSGDLVFDAGAHAGFTTCMFARMVGPGGRVVAFEPDEGTARYLESNVRSQQISNVTIVKKAIDANSGTSYFNADGTMGAGLVEHSVYGNTGRRIAVETLSLEDAFHLFGVPQFLKMDIEGAEIAVIQAAGDLLKRQRMHLAFDSYHRMRDGRFTWMLLEPMLRSVGYEVKSSAEFGQVFTWAKSAD